MRSLVLKSVFVLAFLQGHSAFAANTIVKLGTPSSDSIKSIGTVPEKKFIPLELGGLRDDEPELPISSTLESRMKKRLRMAHKRQSQVGRAKRASNNGQLRRSAKPVEAFQPPAGGPTISEDQPEGLFERPTPFDN